MSIERSTLVDDLSLRFDLDAGPLVEYLYQVLLMDDTLVRRHAMRLRYVHDLVTTAKSDLQIHEDIAEDFGAKRRTIRDAVEVPGALLKVA